MFNLPNIYKTKINVKIIECQCVKAHIRNTIVYRMVYFYLIDELFNTREYQ